MKAHHVHQCYGVRYIHHTVHTDCQSFSLMTMMHEVDWTVIAYFSRLRRLSVPSVEAYQQGCRVTRFSRIQHAIP
jgi:hypothetical protein